MRVHFQNKPRNKHVSQKHLHLQPDTATNHTHAEEKQRFTCDCRSPFLYQQPNQVKNQSFLFHYHQSSRY
jgi:hypothetical protein